MASTQIKLRVPADLELTLDGGQDANGNDVEVTRPFRFLKDFVIRQVLNDKRWIGDTEWTFACMEIRTEFKGKVAGDIVSFTSDQYKKLKECVEKPSGGWQLVPQVICQAKDFIDALLNPLKEEDLKKPAPKPQVVDEVYEAPVQEKSAAS